MSTTCCINNFCFHQICLSGFCRSLAGDLGHALEADAALTSSTSLRTWEETVVAPDDRDAEGGDAMEMRFSLPAAPSPAVLMLLLGTCRELERAGEPCLVAP